MSDGAAIHLGLVGSPVSHSRSPEVHAAFAAAQGLDVSYELLEVGEGALDHELAELRAAGFRGLNVTLPHKLAVMDHCASLSERAATAGAVNTLRLEDLHGDNTDGIGLLRDLQRITGSDVPGDEVLVLGASGAARAAVAALQGAGVGGVCVANRDPGRATALAADLPGTQLVRYDELELARYDLIVNATSASLGGELPPLPAQPFAGIAYDMVVGRGGTAFTRWAEDRGARCTADGWGMLVEQAAESWVTWGLPRPDTGRLLRSRGVASS